VQAFAVPSDSPPRDYPFKKLFDKEPDVPRFVGLARDSAETLARDEGLTTRVLELPVTGKVAWRADRKTNRVNLVVENSRVIRAAVF